MKTASHGHYFFTLQFPEYQFAAVPLYRTYRKMRNITIRDLLFNFYLFCKTSQPASQNNTHRWFLTVILLNKFYCFGNFQHHVPEYFSAKGKIRYVKGMFRVS